MPQSALKAIFGSMTFGDEGLEGIRTTRLADAEAILDVFQAHGHDEIDSARIYGLGSCEPLLARAKWQERGLVMQTKLYPTYGRAMGAADTMYYTHKPDDLRRGLMDSLEALGTDRIDLWYLHGPDRKIVFEDTLREINQLHQEGHFTRWGVSNYMSWEVAQMCEICERNGWIKPSVYQGIYNALHRGIESELLPCLRNYGISLYIYQPLAGGFLTSRYQRDTKDHDIEGGSRFDSTRWQGSLMRGKYWNEYYFGALDIIRPVAQKYGLTETECAFRWLCHHSGLSKEKGDAVIVGASSGEQLDSNLTDMEKGPLPDDVVEALDGAWSHVRGVAPNYFH
ncbi:NADP-dependent oxidoreductase domain-containing protein [Aspergillus ambiguus]|uniref:aldo/keto reductase family protein n=1 Tax=Aspergillus ambiguus TaxID=176160 RepID=UPI003CCD71B0